MKGKPLAGCRVLDLGIITAGASTSALLADLGADVVKVESGHYIDPFRGWDGQAEGTEWWNNSRFFRFTNRNKRSVGINLKDSAGRALFLKLVEQADIVVENFRRGVLERLKLTFSDLREANPRIILASITSQGELGPDRAAASYGSTLEATSGLASVTGYSDGPPVISGLALNYPDQIVSIFAAGVVVAAVIERERTQEAVHLDISQRELASFLIGETIMAEQFSRIGNSDPVVPLQGCFQTIDGLWIAVRAKSLEPLDLLPGLNSKDADAFREWVSQRSLSDVIGLLATAGIYGVQVADAKNLHEAITGGSSRSAFVRDTLGEWVKGFPFQFRASPMQISRTAPNLGEHTRDVLREFLNLSEEDIAQLEQAGITVARPMSAQ